MSLENFEKMSIKTSEMNKVFGGLYEKTGCGSYKAGNITVYYKCDAVDKGGNRPTRYFGESFQIPA